MRTKVDGWIGCHCVIVFEVMGHIDGSEGRCMVGCCIIVDGQKERKTENVTDCYDAMTG